LRIFGSLCRLFQSSFLWSFTAGSDIHRDYFVLRRWRPFKWPRYGSWLALTTIFPDMLEINNSGSFIQSGISAGTNNSRKDLFFSLGALTSILLLHRLQNW
jgi:hypothetical protein